MKYFRIPPCDALKDFISHFWVGTWNASLRKTNTTYYVIAGSLTELVFAFSDHNRQADLLFSRVQGHTHQPGRFPVDGFCHLLGVSLYSHAIPGLFHIPACELNKTFLALDAFLGKEGAILDERMANAAGTQQRIQLLSEYFLSLLKKQPREDLLIARAIGEIKKSMGQVTIEKLAGDFCLSQKQFSRRFKEFSGFSPKMYSRIVRFESVINNNYLNMSNLTGMAHAGGYYDQAHFIHEFRSFTGFAPKDFLKMGEEGR